MIVAKRVIDLVTSNQNKKFEPAARMASAIIELTQTAGGCLPQDLNKRGFSSDEVVKYWHMAQALAEVELKLMSQAQKSTLSSARRK